MNGFALSLVLVGALALAGGCDESTTSEPAQPADFKLKIGQSATAAGVTVSLVDVVGDSRCPTGVQCIWAGEVTVAVEVAEAGRDAARIELALGPDTAKAAAALDGHTLRLLQVDPYPKAERQIERSQYEATLEVEAR